MNKTYRLIWNDALDAWVAVAEIVKSRGKRSSRALLLATALMPLPSMVLAQAPAPTQLPTGGNVVAGTANIAQSGAVMNITQTTQRAAIDWNTFNVGSSATVNFLQPSSSAVALNRVLSSNPSQIFGQINANGHVFLTNPSGVYFAPGASVDVGSLTATTHSISNADFMAGNYKFTRSGSTGSVVNEGTLKAGLGGYIALLAPEVRNQGVIIAQAGTVAMAAGETITLQMSSNNTLANLEVEASTIAALVENRHAVQAPGGLIILSARAADQLQGSVVKNSGTLAATSLGLKAGRIVLTAEGGSVVQEGSILSSSGEVNISAADVYFGNGVTSVASRSEDGGLIRVESSSNLSAVSAHTFDASGSQGGRIELIGGENADVLLSSSINADGVRDQGGRVQITGRNVSLLSARVSADGVRAGGTVNIGGEWQGGGTLKHTKETHLNASSTITAKSLDGAGGTISLWSSDYTNFQGTLDTSGKDGMGGRIEVSSMGGMSTSGQITTGSGGLLLFDPKNIIISTSTGLGYVTSVALPGTNNVDYSSSTDTRAWGQSYAMDGDHLAIGLRSYVQAGSTTGICASICGAVYLYRGASSTNWGSLAFVSRITNPGGTTPLTGVSGSPPSLGTGYTYFGQAIALNNGRMAIGAPYYDSTANSKGGVFLFTYADGFASVSYNQKIDALTPISGMPTLTNNANLGEALAFASGGDKLLIGASNGVYLFDGLGTAASTFGTITYRNTINGLVAGSYASSAYDLATDGDKLAVSTGSRVNLFDGLNSANFTGLTYRNYLDFTASNSLGAPALVTGDGFGSAVGIVGDKLYIGAGKYNSLTGPPRPADYGYGRVYVFSGMNSANIGSLAYSDLIGSGTYGLTLSTNSNFGFALVADSTRIVAGGQSNVRLFSILPDGYTMSSSTVAFSDGGSGASWVITPTQIKSYLDVGTSVVLQANNDITVASALTANNAGGNGGDLSLLAGRSIAVNAAITTDNGNLTLVAGHSGADSAHKDAGTPSITLAANINTGTGTLDLQSSGSVTQSSGVITANLLTASLTGSSSALNLATLTNAITSLGALTAPGGITLNNRNAGLTLTGNLTTTNSALSLDVGTRTLTQNTATTVSAGSGNISLTADALTLNGTAALTGTGTLTIKPFTASRTIGIAGGAGSMALAASYFSTNFLNGFSGITIGRSDGTGKITAGAFSVSDNLTLLNTTGGIELTGLLNASTNTVTLNSTGTVTDTGSGSITAGSLALLGTGGSFTLDSTSNNVSTLAANTGIVNYVDADALTIGTVGSTNGITATGTVSLATQTGSLTVSQNISTTNTGTSAVVLNAAQSTAAGTSAGGDIVLSGSPGITVGSGGRATLFTGSVSGSTGLTTLLGSGSGRFRYNSDETATNYTAALGTGLHAIYREQPTLSITPSTATSIYGNAANLTGVTVTATGVNGDDATKAGLTGTASFTTTATNTSSVGSYNIAYQSGLSNTVGYALADNSSSTGEYSITARPITVTAANQSRAYGDANPSSGTTTVTTGSLVNGDTLSTATVSSTANATTAAGQTAALTPSVQTFSAGTAGNYQISYADGTLSITAATTTTTTTTTTPLPPPPPPPSMPSPGSSPPPLNTGGITTTPTSGSGGASSGETTTTTTNTGSGGTTTTASGGTGGTGTTSGGTTSGGAGGSGGGAGGTGTTSGGTTSGGTGGSGGTTGTGGTQGGGQPLGQPQPSSQPELQTQFALVQGANSGAASSGGSASGDGAPGTTAGSSGGISVSLVRQPSAQDVGIIAVSIPKETATTGTGFTFPLPNQVCADAQANDPVQVTMENGTPLPSWLRFAPETKCFVATAVPDGAFPIQVIVRVGSRSTTVVISERTE